MWDGITYVDPSRRPVVHEGSSETNVIATNVGPGTVSLMAWTSPPAKFGEADPSIEMNMPPGDTRSASGGMIAFRLIEGKEPFASSIPRFAAVGWRIVR